MPVALGIIGAGIIGAGASLAGSSMQASAAKNASNMTAQQFQQTRSDLMPYQQSGGAALSQLDYLLGIGGAPGSGPAPTQSQFMMAGPNTNTNVPQYLQGHSTDYGGAPNGILTPNPAYNNQQVPNVQAYQQALAAYQQQQQAATNNPAYGSLLQPFTQAQFQQSPDYQFNLSQGQLAIDKAAAARGNYYAPQTLQDTAQFSQGLASQEFNNAYNQYNTNQQNIYNRLYNQAGVGQSAANQTGAFGANSVNQQAGLVTGGAAATAGGIQGAGMSLSQLAYLPQILSQQQTASYSPAPAQYGYSGETGLSTMY